MFRFIEKRRSPAEPAGSPRARARRAKSRLPGAAALLWPAALTLLLLSACASAGGKKEAAPAGAQADSGRPLVHIAWRPSVDSDTYRGVLLALEKAGAQFSMLPQVRSFDVNYDKQGMIEPDCLTEKGMLTLDCAQKIREKGRTRSNLAEIVAQHKIQALVFTGGGDISPSLFQTPESEQNAGEAFEPERDVSDFLLMQYCLDHNIPVLAICRGMQMMALVCGGRMIQDFSLYFQQQGLVYDNLHREPPSESQDFAVHDVTLTPGDTIFRRLVGADKLCRVPSWHHQGVLMTDSDSFVTSGYTVTCGIPVVEAMEIPGKDFALGLQFHGEIVISGNPEGKEKDFFDYDTALGFFAALARYAE